MACDAKWLTHAPAPFLVSIAPGRYPVILTIAGFSDGDQRVAYATVQIVEREPVGWEVARCPGDDVEGAVDDPAYASAYDVDSGKGCFMDADLLPCLDKRRAAEDAEGPWYERGADGYSYEMAIDEGLSRTRVHTWGWTIISPEVESTANMVVFSAGLGDGAYVTFVGYDRAGVPVCLTTDFAIFDVMVADEQDDEM